MKELISFIVILIFLVLWNYLIEPFISEIFARKAIKHGELSKLKSLGFKDVGNRLFGKHKDYIIIIKKTWSLPHFIYKNSRITIRIR
jgi:hypothetical protein